MNRNARGFTLIELLVVLTILAILTTLAVTSVDGIQDQTRYDATQRGLQNLSDAIIGPQNQHDSSGNPFVSGFVADMGRLPRAVDQDGDSSTPLQPAELWINPYPAVSFAIRPADTTNIPIADAALADSEVKVPCGWRGPYLRLAAGETVLRDGWGRPFELLKATNVSNNRVLILPTDTNAEREIKIFRSLGADGTLNGVATNDYKEDLYLNIATDAFAAPAYPITSASNLYQVPVTITVHKIPHSPDPDGFGAGTKIGIRVYGPNPSPDDNRSIKVIAFTKTITDSVTDPNLEAQTDQPVSFTIPGATIGPKMIRAYLDDATVSVGSTVRRSAPLEIVVTQNGQNSFDINLKP